MKILFLNQVFYPDAAATAQHTSDLSRYLQGKNGQVTVVTGRRNYNHRSQIYPRRENYHGVEVRRVWSTGFGKGRFLFRLIDAITFDLALMWELLFLPPQDTVIALTSPPLIGFIGALFCLFKGGRLISWMMDVNPEAAITVGYLKRGSLVSRILTEIFEFSLKHSQVIVVLDRWMKKKIESHGVPSEKICVIPPWPVSLVVPSQTLKRENPFREKYGLQEKFILLYSGNHSIVHPLDTLLEAAVRLKENQTVQFVFAGSGLRVADVTQTIEKHQLKNVLQLSHQPRELLEASLSMANLHVVVMGNEVSGLVHTSKIYGVLATGTPYVVIGPRESHLVDLLKACPYGFHVEHGNVNTLLEAIEKARALTESEIREYEEKNTRFLENHYSAERALQAFSDQILAYQPIDSTAHVTSPL